MGVQHSHEAKTRRERTLRDESSTWRASMPLIDDFKCASSVSILAVRSKRVCSAETATRKYELPRLAAGESMVTSRLVARENKGRTGRGVHVVTWCRKAVCLLMLGDGGRFPNGAAFKSAPASRKI